MNSNLYISHSKNAGDGFILVRLELSKQMCCLLFLRENNLTSKTLNCNVLKFALIKLCNIFILIKKDKNRKTVQKRNTYVFASFLSRFWVLSCTMHISSVRFKYWHSIRKPNVYNKQFEKTFAFIILFHYFEPEKIQEKMHIATQEPN